MGAHHCARRAGSGVGCAWNGPRLGEPPGNGRNERAEGPGRGRIREHRHRKGFERTAGSDRPPWVRSGPSAYGVMTTCRVEIPPVGAIELP